MSNAKINKVAFYLPQFHTIKENDDFWGQGFTEWTKVRNAKRILKDQNQPKIPSRFGYYTLLDQATRQKQAEFAKIIGIDVFCYWHYFLGKKKTLLDEPLKLMLKDGEPNIKFMFAWANESWTGIWHGLDKTIIAEQTYSKSDIDWHFEYLAKFFESQNYFIYQNKIPIVIYKPDNIPYFVELKNIWNEKSQERFGREIMFIGYFTSKAESNIDKRLNQDYFWFPFESLLYKKIFQNLQIPYKKNYEALVNRFKSTILQRNEIPVIFSNWDNTPRLGPKGFLFKKFSKALFYEFYRIAQFKVLNNSETMIFIKSWNEWAEGNILEPEIIDGEEFYLNLNSLE